MKTMLQKHLLTALSVVFAAVGIALTTNAHAANRDYITIVGSSTVYPFATIVAENLGKQGKFKTPKVESTGTGGGMKLFCAGNGIDTPDITNASRKIKSSEIDTCVANNVLGVVEVPIGYDGLTIANAKSAPKLSLTLEQIYFALAKEIPDGKGGMKPNPNKTWSDVDKSLPATKIEVIGPPPSSGTRDSFNELAVEGGCGKVPAMKEVKAQDTKKFETLCRAIREDGYYIEAGENDNLIVQKLAANPNALGIFGYSFLEENADKVKAVAIGGVEPGFETVLNNTYPLARGLYYYVKKSHIGKVPGIQEYMAEFSSKKATGEEGYLADKGLIPLPADKAEKAAKDAAALKALTMMQKLP